MSKTTERVHFRLLRTNCCGALLCWVNPRFPSFCPECGSRVYPEIKGCVTHSDDTALLMVEEFHG
jgi:hypothetical protein